MQHEGAAHAPCCNNVDIKYSCTIFGKQSVFLMMFGTKLFKGGHVTLV